MPLAPVLLASKGGIKRDGTRFEGNNYVDGRWCRFQRGKPRKIGGYQQVTDTVPEITRGMTSFSADGVQFLHLGHPNTLGQYQVAAGTLNAFNDRTPAALTTSLDNLWQFAVFPDTTGSGDQVLVAHAAPNLANIDNSITRPIVSGAVTGTGILTPGTVIAADVSGGIVAVGVFLFSYGSDGFIEYTVPNDLTVSDTMASVTEQKIVFGIPIRGAGIGPAALFWSLDSLIRATFQQDVTLPTFAFDTLSTEISVLSSQAIVEYDGIYYWPGVDRWQVFNGVVREVPNNTNQNFFFDNLNFAHRQKVFGFKVPRFGEIWWCYPRGSATECTHAIIFNVRENTWYDTPLPDSDDLNQGRTAGVFAKVYQKPFMVDNEVTANGRTIWQHETTKDKVRSSQISAVQSFFETHELSLLEEGQGTQSIRVARIEPDFVQAGDMTLTVKGRMNAKAPQVTEAAQTFVATPTEGTDETIKLKSIQRLMSFRWESNTGGGDYEYGDTYVHLEPADGRVES